MKISVLTVAIILVTLSLATADSTLNQLPSLVFYDASDEAVGPPPIIHADNFIVSTGGLGFDLEQVVVWGGYVPGNTPLAVDSFGVVIHEDDAGLPGAIVCSETGIVPTSRTLTGHVWPSNVEQYTYTLDLAVPCSLTDGTYWAEVYNDSSAAAGGDQWYRDRGTLDPTNGVADNSFTFRTPPDWYPELNIEAAMQLNGTTLPVELQSFSIE